MQFCGNQKMNKFCVDLKSSLKLLNDDYDPFSAPMGHTTLDTKHIREDFLKLIDSLNLKLLYVEIFVKGPDYGPGVHVDHGRIDQAKINWVYGGKDSCMTWYKIIPNKVRDIKLNVTPINSYSVVYPEHTVEEIHKQEVKCPSMIQSGIPHGIYTKDDSRWCYSAVLLTKDNKRLTFDAMLELFKDFI